MVDLNESPGVWHGIAEGHVWLPCAERLKIALKACDLYLKLVEDLEKQLPNNTPEQGRERSDDRDNRP